MNLSLPHVKLLFFFFFHVINLLREVQVYQAAEVHTSVNKSTRQRGLHCVVMILQNFIIGHFYILNIMGAGDLITRLKEHFIVLYNSQLHVLKFHKEIIVIGQDSYI